MTWTINLMGHDDLSSDEKIALENQIVEEATALAKSLEAKDGIRLTSATVVTNTHGSVNILA